MKRENKLMRLELQKLRTFGNSDVGSFYNYDISSPKSINTKGDLTHAFQLGYHNPTEVKRTGGLMILNTDNSLPNSDEEDTYKQDTGSVEDDDDGFQ